MFPSTRSARVLLAGMVAGGWLLLAAPVSAQVPASSVEVCVLDDGTVATVFRYDEPVVAGDGVFVHVLGAETRFAGAGISLEGQDPASWTPETPPEGPIEAFWTFDGWGADVDQIQVWLWLADVGGVEAVGVAYPPGTLDPDEIVSCEAGWSFSGEGFVSELPVVRAPSDVAEFDWRRDFQPSGDLRGDIRRLSEALGPVDEFPTDPAERERWIRGRIRWRLQEELKRMEEKGVTPPEHLDLGDDLPIEVKRIAAEEWRTLREIGVGASTDPPSSGTGSPDRTDDGDEPDDQDFEETIL